MKVVYLLQMRSPGNLKNRSNTVYNRYSDNLARRRRRHFFVYSVAGAISIALLSYLVLYVCFYSGWFKIIEITINGSSGSTADEVLSGAEYFIQERRWPGVNIRPRENIFIFNVDDFRRSAVLKLPIIKNIEVLKYPPHAITVNIDERKPVGIWCFNGADNCRYFDEDGAVWGEAPDSSGRLLIIIKDQRPAENFYSIEEKWLDSIMKVSALTEGLDLTVKNFEIPADTIGEFQAYLLGGERVIFNADSDIERQINVLKVFLDGQPETFRAEYIDLRIDGRVYYK